MHVRACPRQHRYSGVQLGGAAAESQERTRETVPPRKRKAVSNLPQLAEARGMFRELLPVVQYMSDSQFNASLSLSFQPVVLILEEREGKLPGARAQGC